MKIFRTLILLLALLAHGIAMAGGGATRVSAGCVEAGPAIALEHTCQMACCAALAESENAGCGCAQAPNDPRQPTPVAPAPMGERCSVSTALVPIAQSENFLQPATSAASQRVSVPRCANRESVVAPVSRAVLFCSFLT